MRTNDTPHCPKKSFLSFSMTRQFVSILVASVTHTLPFGPTVTIILPQNISYLYRFTVLFTLVLCQEIGSNSCKLSMSHLRSNVNVHKWCTTLYMAPCTQLFVAVTCISNFLVLYFEVILGHNFGG